MENENLYSYNGSLYKFVIEDFGTVTFKNVATGETVRARKVCESEFVVGYYAGIGKVPVDILSFPSVEEFKEVEDTTNQK
jgi:hypothetical protein